MSSERGSEVSGDLRTHSVVGPAANRGVQQRDSTDGNLCLPFRAIATLCSSTGFSGCRLPLRGMVYDEAEAQAPSLRESLGRRHLGAANPGGQLGVASDNCIHVRVLRKQLCKSRQQPSSLLHIRGIEIPCAGAVSTPLAHECTSM